jgi:hypothetical protein
MLLPRRFEYSTISPKVNCSDGGIAYLRTGINETYARTTTAILAVLALRSFAPSITVNIMKAKKNIGT